MFEDLFDRCDSFDRFNRFVAEAKYPWFKGISNREGSSVSIDGRNLIMLTSNDYLGLAAHTRVVEATARAVERFGANCSGSRFLNGSLELHEELETDLAKFTGREAVQIFPTGFQANQGAVSTLTGPGDVVILDQLVHASVVSGAVLSQAHVDRFRHNSPESFDKRLEKASRTYKSALVVIDGVYSMDGDLAKLVEISQVCQRFGARLMLDDAHGTGVFGKNGRGSWEYLGDKCRIDLLMGCMSKAIAGLGGFLAGDATVISYIRHNAHALIFTTSGTPADVAAAKESLQVIKDEPEIRARLWSNTNFLREGLDKLGFDIGQTESPIIPIIVGDEDLMVDFWNRLWTEGLFFGAIMPPAAPTGTCRLRMCVMATHTQKDIERVLEICGRVGREMGICCK
jgi:8-amino-7-oxononanoate synthase